jgi:hypothetical protein
VIVNPTRELLFAVIEQAVHDRRAAVSHGLIDDMANPIPQNKLRKKVRNDKHGITCSLNYFFYRGGLEFLMSVADIEHDPELIKKRSGEPHGK